MPLNEKAMIAEIELKKWSGRKLDQKISRKVVTDHNARHDSARVTKLLMPDEPKLTEIRKKQGLARNYHYQHTHPWGEQRGNRILPTALYMDYHKQMEVMMDDIQSTIDEFCDESYFQNAVQRSMAQLGTLVTRDDYPKTGAEVKKFFKAGVHYQAIAATGDFRINLGVKELAELKAAASERERQIIEQATESTWEKVHSLMEHATNKLSDPDAKFHRSLPGNIKKFTEIVGALNIGEDKFIDEIAKEIAPLGNADFEELRDDPTIRAEAATTAKSALDKIKEKIKAMEASKNA
jgi:hypothetical protein